MEISTWIAFISIALVATITPGPAILLVLSHSLKTGWKSSLYTILGNITGLFVMSSCAVLGLSALVLSSSTAFMVIKYLGAIYLVYLGIKIWRSNLSLKTSDLIEHTKPRKHSYFLQGVLVALTNPKAIVFTTALFPQFITIEADLLPQFSLLVSTFLCCSATCLISYSYWGSRLLKRSKSLSDSHWIPRTIASTFIGTGIALAISSRQ
ncbi:LysE family translocator [Neptuniibacter sp. QD37_6]|uniref:LysE family translocator n=1 Tax=Neptuniibacter sp. QD37_6 TaxID=3398210 RepID=UPI0039F4D417